jgi:hypothetical protein
MPASKAGALGHLATPQHYLKKANLNAILRGAQSTQLRLKTQAQRSLKAIFLFSFKNLRLQILSTNEDISFAGLWLPSLLHLLLRK